jgi:hypothetical protein
MHSQPKLDLSRRFASCFIGTDMNALQRFTVKVSAAEPTILPRNGRGSLPGAGSVRALSLKGSASI